MKFTDLFNLPIVASAHGHEIDMMIYLVHALMFVLFFGWGIYYVIVLIRFNKKSNPKASYEGTTSHVSSYIEAAVAIIEVILLVGFSIPFWAKQVNAYPTRSDTIEVRINAEQFAWNVHYPGADGKFGKTSIDDFDKQSNPMGISASDPNAKDDVTTINQLHLPVGRPVVIHLTSRDVMHSFGIPVMRVKQDIIPGMSIPTWFIPTKTGQWEIACAQLCGLGHYRMRGFVNIQTPEEYQKWLDEQETAGGDGEESADDFWQ